MALPAIWVMLERTRDMWMSLSTVLLYLVEERERMFIYYNTHFSAMIIIADTRIISNISNDKKY